MKFTELMLLYTRPLYWDPNSSSSNAQRLRELLLYLLEPKKPGLGALQVRDSAGKAVSDWFEGEYAVQWINDAYKQVWQPGAELLQAQGNGTSEQVYRLYVQQRVEVFLDNKRLADCVTTAVPDGTYLGFYVDWYSSGSSLVWMPQLRIYNYWPHNRSLAPPPLPEVTAPSPLEPKDAADVLFRNFWREVADGFRELRYNFKLGVAPLVSGPERFLAPVFFYAKPRSMPDTPEKMLSHTRLAALQALSSRTLGTHDLLSEDVSGAFLEGNLVTFRQEKQRDGYSSTHYLVVPWLPKGGASLAEVEDELRSVAHKLAIIEFDAGRRVDDVMVELATPKKLMNSWESTLDEAESLTRELQNQLFTPGNGQDTTIFQMVWLLRSLVWRVEAKTNDVLRLENKWRAAIEHTCRLARQQLTARSLPQVAAPLENLGETGPYQLYEEEVDQAAQRVPQLQGRFRSIISALQHMQEHEQRQEKEREERRGQILGAILGVLTAVTAFPILVGQLGWKDLRKEMKGWISPLDWVGGVYQDLHSFLVFLAMVSATLIIALVVGMTLSRVLQNFTQGQPLLGTPVNIGMILLTFLQSTRWWRKGDDLPKIRNKIIEVGQLVKEAKPAVDELRRAGSVSFRLSEVLNEPEKIEKRRQEIDKKDKQACERLVQVSDWLEERCHEPEVGSIANAQALRAKVDRFIIHTEFLNNRPDPLPLPRALCLYRYKYDVISDFEFQQVLNWYGFRDEEVEAIDSIAERTKHLSARELISALQQAGVSALHETTVIPPAEHLDLAGHALVAQTDLSPISLHLGNGE